METLLPAADDLVGVLGGRGGLSRGRSREERGLSLLRGGGCGWEEGGLGGLRGRGGGGGRLAVAALSDQVGILAAADAGVEEQVGGAHHEGGLQGAVDVDADPEVDAALGCLKLERNKIGRS